MSSPTALYLALYRYVNGPGAVAKFPCRAGTSFVYTFSDSSQDVIVRSEIYLSIVKPDEADGEGFNTANTAKPSSWSQNDRLSANTLD